jgi:hypothetical protein
MRVLAVIIISLAAALGIAVIVWTASRGHVIFFPLVLLFRIPFIPLLGRRGIPGKNAQGSQKHD